MTKLKASRAIQFAVMTLGASALCLSLAACANPNPVAATGTPSASATATSTPTSAALVGVAMTLNCNDILSSDALYALKGGTNLAPDPNFKPATDSPAEKIVGLKGVACGFTNLTSGDTFNVSVAQLTPESITALKSALESSPGAGALVASYSPTDQIKGYFSVADGVGQAQVATSAYWISVSSDTYSEAGDAEQVVVDVENALGR